MWQAVSAMEGEKQSKKVRMGGQVPESQGRISERTGEETSGCWSLTCLCVATSLVPVFTSMEWGQEGAVIRGMDRGACAPHL